MKREIDNGLYDRLADTWWNANAFLNLLESTINPWRLRYFERVITQLEIDPHRAHALDVGCGGGILAESLASMGFSVTGVDPSIQSLKTARDHARKRNLSIDYQAGTGTHLQFADKSFDVVFCCDVLEHIVDWDSVIGEIGRVLPRDGLVFFDTINRTFASKLRSIYIAQQWKWTRFAPPDTHVWEMFITPAELTESFERHGFRMGGIVGTAEKGNPISALRLIRHYKTGRITSAEFGRRLNMTEGPVISGSYMGHAIKL
ncbi:MAG TPA: bifunctional 2-polyprenyl-6-hydroxyphenol methylase/3-demethylubiquinol 3-O-methyltransferase UbiG [Gemmatimonadaceae bacterium]|nr:bifunctional 2-polyprenyl-6-hydroxyphenol methylase/3-demethylubiquinol 3-O-methyltransferase UbiG [Gemmatimonadaceae bacterium]